MEHLPKDIFNYLMLDIIGKYSGPPVTAADVPHRGLPGPSEPQPEMDDAELPDEGEDACCASPAGSGTDSQEDISLQGGGDSWRSGSPAEIEDLASDSCSESSSLDSREDTSSPGHADCWPSSSPTETKILASNSPLGAKGQVSREDTSSPGHAGCWPSSSPTETKVLASNSPLGASGQVSRNDTFLPGHVSHWPSSSPTETKVLASNSPLGAKGQVSTEDTSSPEHAGCWPSSSPTETKVLASNSPLGAKGQVSRNYTFSPGHVSHWPSSSPTEMKILASNSSLGAKGQLSQNDTSSPGHVSHWPSSSPTETKILASSSPLGERGQVSRNDTSSPGCVSPSERKEDICDNCSNLSHQKYLSRKYVRKRVRNGYGLLNLKRLLINWNFTKECERKLKNWAHIDLKIIGADLTRVHPTLFENLILAFRIHLSSELFFSGYKWCLHHPSFQRPTMDSDIHLLCNRRGPETEARFLKDVEPLDKKLEDIQHFLMKATMPLFVISHHFAVTENPQKGKLPTMKNVLHMCRQSMVMCGQVFSALSTLRQERVLDTFDLPGNRPSPSRYPNIENACLFGKEYTFELARFMHERNLLAGVPPATPKKETNPHNLDELVDEKTTCAIEKLTRFVAEMGLEMDVFNVEKMASNPNFWFLTVKESPAYKLYQKKLAEFRQSLGSSSDSRKLQDLTLNSQPKAPEVLDLKPQGFALAPKGTLAQPLNSSGSATPPEKDCFIVPLAPPPRKRSGPPNTLRVRAKRIFSEEPPKGTVGSPPCEPASRKGQTSIAGIGSQGVDAKTRAIVEELAHFVVKGVPDKEKLEKLTTVPEYWFLNNVDSPEYRLYQNRLTALRRATQIPPLPSKPQPVVQFICRTVEQTAPPNPNPQNPSSQGSEAQGALLLLSEIYDSDEEDSASQDLGPRDIKLRAAQLKKAQLRKSVLKDTAAKGPKLPHDPHLGIRLL